MVLRTSSTNHFHQQITFLQTCRFQLADDIQGDLCSNNPWLVLHKIDSPTKMRFVGNQVRDCPTDSWQDAHAMAPSLAPFLPRAGALHARWLAL